MFFSFAHLIFLESHWYLLHVKDERIVPQCLRLLKRDLLGLLEPHYPMQL
uniref:Uncharacterized protein n=1 Tax=Arundo donax TaxID=35708 RepID=A0A0A9AJU6_ARUDO